MTGEKMPFLRKEGGETHAAESAAGGYPCGDHDSGGSAAASGLHGGVTDRREEFLEGLLGVFLAAVSAALCAAIDCLLQEGTHKK